MPSQVLSVFSYLNLDLYAYRPLIFFFRPAFTVSIDTDDIHFKICVPNDGSG